LLVINRLGDLHYQLCAFHNSNEILARVNEKKKGQLDNFHLKETIASLIDQLSCFKIENNEEIELRFGILPNEVNGDYGLFKQAFYSIISTFIQLSLPLQKLKLKTLSLECSPLRYGSQKELNLTNLGSGSFIFDQLLSQVVIELDYEKVLESNEQNKSNHKRYAYNIKCQGLSLSQEDHNIIKGIS